MKKVEVESCGQCKKEFTCKATGASIRRGRGLWVPGPNCPLPDDRTEALEAEVDRLKAQLAELREAVAWWSECQKLSEYLEHYCFCFLCGEGEISQNLFSAEAELKRLAGVTP